MGRSTAMISRRAALALIAFVCACSPAFASDAPRPFDKAAFDAELASGRPFLVHVSAPWCPICRLQKPALAKLRDQPRFKGFGLFEIAFDDDKPSMRVVGAQLQSTLILYKGGKEIARTVGDREEGWIEDLMEKAL